MLKHIIRKIHKECLSGRENLMENKIRIGIVGYGNLGKGVEMAISQNPDIELVAIFTRRDPDSISCSSTLISLDNLSEYKDRIDIMILCCGSATDLPTMGPELAAEFNTVDSFDTHAKIPEYFEKVNAAAKKSGNLSLISTGWDPGLFSLNRLLGETVLPVGKEYTFWGKGVSQGHSDAVRRISGVINCIQYTIPIEESINRIREGEVPSLKTGEKHIRVCYVVPEEDADLIGIEREIKTMPNYFEDYDTTVHFITEEELKANHSGMPHGGVVIRAGKTGGGYNQRMEFSLTLENNPEFTSSVLLAYARAVYKLSKEGQTGARTLFDIPLGYLSPKPAEQLRKELL